MEKVKEKEVAAAPKKKKEVLSGADILIRALLAEDVEYVFGYPGGVVIPIFDKLYSAPRPKVVLTRHEQGAQHMADGYARSSGKVGVCLVTSGPGATNLVTGIATSFMDSVPVVCLTGQVATAVIGNDAFQEVDITGITRPITKHNYLVRDTADLARTIKEAFYIAGTGRPGPVLVDLPKDVLISQVEFDYPDKVDIPGYKPTGEGHIQQIKKVAEVMAAARRPVFYVGGGCITANAAGELTDLARTAKIPVTTTLLGLGAFPENDPLSLGMLGMHGTWYANMAVNECDLLIAVGARFDDRVTGKLDDFAPKAEVIHLDVDPASISKNIKVDYPVVGDCRKILQRLSPLAREADTADWLKLIGHWKQTHPLKYQKSDRIKPQYVCEAIRKVCGEKAIITTDVGQHQMWAALHCGFFGPRTMITSGGLGTMGYGFPAALGAALANPDKKVVAVVGDGGLQMNMQEFATAVGQRLNVIVALFNNGFLGMVRQWQELFFGKRYSHTCLEYTNPDFVKLVEAFGAVGLRVDRHDEVVPVLEKAMSIKNLPVMIDFHIDRHENVFPMIPPGQMATDIIE
ncbi:MAG: biosynthetic-type acetolactate synthase large subunit [Candidatus Glassbacteria bacterium]|nr:biosynthetic-type acetolactate synthase large subunit [Candidatus Glassbacteria bacterium]